MSWSGGCGVCLDLGEVLRTIARMSDLTRLRGEPHYEIVRKIYEGGMGVVYEALQHGARGFVKRVAIKVVRDRFLQHPEFVGNFVGEACLVADLIHTNIVQTYHLGESEGSCYICMELIRGVNLEQFRERLVQRGQVLPVELAVFIVSRIARGLAYAHAKTDPHGMPLGIVHRDVSPKNVMIAFEGDVKLTDFGIAKARGFLKDKEGQEVAGKPEYMSPEQADFQVTDRRSDVFSAGTVLLWLLTGTNPFRAGTAEATQRRVVECVLPDPEQLNPAMGPEIANILRRAMAKDPADRFQTADDLLQSLERAIYARGYGPTNETLGRFIRDLFPEEVAPAGPDAAGAATVKISAGSARPRGEVCDPPALSLFERIQRTFR